MIFWAIHIPGGCWGGSLAVQSTERSGCCRVETCCLPWLCCLSLWQLQAGSSEWYWYTTSLGICFLLPCFQFHFFLPLPDIAIAPHNRCFNKYIMGILHWVSSRAPTSLQQPEDIGDESSGCCDSVSHQNICAAPLVSQALGSEVHPVVSVVASKVKSLQQQIL